MAKADDEYARGREPMQRPYVEPAPRPDVPAAVRRSRRTLLGRINNYFGHLVGASGRRRGARDTDPGH